MSQTTNHPESLFCDRFFHRASAARRAISDRFALLSFAARAFPPLSPPSRPRATAAEFFSLGFCPVVSLTIESASSLGSDDLSFLERLGMGT